MNIQCRFANECNEYRSSCMKCLHNQRRNAPQTFFEEAHDDDFANAPMRRGVNLTIKEGTGIGTYIYSCPACGETIDVGVQDEDGYISRCESCGLTVITLY